MAYIIDGLRVATGKAGGYYKTVLPETLVAVLLDSLITRNTVNPSELDEVLLANSFGTGGNMARYAALLSDIPAVVPATTIDMQCSGGLKSVVMANAMIESGSHSLIMAGGMESNSLATEKTYHVNDPRFDQYPDGKYRIAKFSPEQTGSEPLLEAAKKAAIIYDITKREMLEWTVKSFEKASAAWESGFMEDIVFSVFGMGPDQTLKPGLTVEKLKRLQTDQLIDFTNTAHHHDGAAVLLLADEASVLKNNWKPKARIVTSVSIGGDPGLAPLGPIWATEKLLEKDGINIQDIDLLEINESFALKPLAFSKKFGVDQDKINVLGGNLAFGHPFGASGAMNLLHLVKALEVKDKKLGLVAMGAAGGQGVAVLMERL